MLKNGSLAPEIHGLKIEVYIEFEGEIHLDNKHRFLFMEAIRALRATDFYFNFRVDFGISVIDFDILLDHSQTVYFGLCNNYYNTKPNSVQALLHTAVGVYPPNMVIVTAADGMTSLSPLRIKSREDSHH